MLSPGCRFSECLRSRCMTLSTAVPLIVLDVIHVNGTRNDHRERQRVVMQHVVEKDL